QTCTEFSHGDKNLQKFKLRLTGPFEKVGLDVIGPLRKTESGNRFIVTAIDHLSRWGEARAIKKKSAKNIALFIWEEIILRHGPPARILTDQGAEFMNRVVEKLCQMVGSKKTYTSAYNPKCNGACERFNRSLMEKLIKICNKDADDWDEVLPIALYCYRRCPIGRL
ncbi:putative LTR retrotransposon, partial [Pseudoloma neurophilia]